MKKMDFHDVRLLDVKSHELFSDVMRLLFVHLSEAPEEWDDCRTDYEKIVYLIKNMHTMDKESKAYISGEFDDIFKESEIHGLAMEDAVAYSESRTRLREMQAAIDYAADDSYQKGMEKGMEKGILEGERKQARRMAKGLMELGLPIADICRISGLSKDELCKES